MLTRRTSVVSALVSRRVSVRLSEAASRYCLSASEIVAAGVESIAANLDAIEEQVRYYGCDENAWRTAISSLISAGGVLFEFLKPIIGKLRGEGILLPTSMTLSEKPGGFAVQFVSIDPWLDLVTVRIAPGVVEASYAFVIGTPGIVPNFDDVVRRVQNVLPRDVVVERSGEEARLTYSTRCSSYDKLMGVDAIASMFADILRKAGVEWLVAEVEHGYKPEKHFALARMFWEHGKRIESLYEKTVNLLRCSEELVKGLAKKEGLNDIVETSAAALWTPQLLDEAVERLKGRYPKLPGLWEHVVEASVGLQEAALQREEVEKLEARLEDVLRSLSII